MGPDTYGIVSLTRLSGCLRELPGSWRQSGLRYLELCQLITGCLDPLPGSWEIILTSILETIRAQIPGTLSTKHSLSDCLIPLMGDNKGPNIYCIVSLAQSARLAQSYRETIRTSYLQYCQLHKDYSIFRLKGMATLNL